MLRAERNLVATETGPGTPVGNLFRRYWIPAMHAVGAAGERMPAGAGQAPLGAAARLARHARATPRSPMSSARIAACRCGSVATSRTGCAARIMAGSTTTPASASRCRRSRPKAASARRSS